MDKNNDQKNSSLFSQQRKGVFSLGLSSLFKLSSFLKRDDGCNTFLLLKRAWHDPNNIGAIWPSSSFLGQAMLAGLSLQKGELVVEYGPGTGPFTREIERALLPQGISYLGIEYDEALYQLLAKQFSSSASAPMRFHHGSAAETPQILEQYSFPKAALIVSGLPFSVMPESLQEQILIAAAKSLRPGGRFRAFRYLLASLTPAARRFDELVQRYFSPIEKRKIVWRNFPPAEVLSYQVKV